VDDDGNALRVIVIEELALTTVVGLSRSIAADGLIVLPGGPAPLNEEHIALGESSVVVLNTGIGLIITTLLHLHNGVSSLVHLVH
jgi:hypothetical protein